MNSIQKYTTYRGQLTDSKFTVTIKNIEKFIELQYTRAILVFKNTSMFDLWDKLYSPPIFCNTVSRNSFMSIINNCGFMTYVLEDSIDLNISFLCFIKL